MRINQGLGFTQKELRTQIISEDKPRHTKKPAPATRQLQPEPDLPSQAQIEARLDQYQPKMAGRVIELADENNRTVDSTSYQNNEAVGSYKIEPYQLEPQSIKAIHAYQATFEHEQLEQLANLVGLDVYV